MTTTLATIPARHLRWLSLALDPETARAAINGIFIERAAEGCILVATDAAAMLVIKSAEAQLPEGALNFTFTPARGLIAHVQRPEGWDPELSGYDHDGELISLIEHPGVGAINPFSYPGWRNISGLWEPNEDLRSFDSRHLARFAPISRDTGKIINWSLGSRRKDPRQQPCGHGWIDGMPEMLIFTMGVSNPVAPPAIPDWAMAKP